MHETWVGKITWRMEQPPIPVFWPGESHGQRSLAGCSPWGCRVGHNLETEQQQDSNVHNFLQFLSLTLWLLQQIMSSSQRKMYLSLYAQWLAHSMCSKMSIGWSDWRINGRLFLLAFAIFNMSRVVYVQNLTQFFLFFLDQSCPMKI